MKEKISEMNSSELGKEGGVIEEEVEEEEEEDEDWVYNG